MSLGKPKFKADDIRELQTSKLKRNVGRENDTQHWIARPAMSSKKVCGSICYFITRKTERRFVIFLYDAFPQKTYCIVDAQPKKWNNRYNMRLPRELIGKHIVISRDRYHMQKALAQQVPYFREKELRSRKHGQR